MRAVFCILWTTIFFVRPGFSGPYALDTCRETALVAAGSVLSVAGWCLSNRLKPPDPAALDEKDMNCWDRPAVRFRSRPAARWSDGLMIACVMMPFATGLTHPDGRMRAAVMAAESLLLTYGVTKLFKGTFPRARPYVYRTDSRMTALSGDASAGFFSGHTGLAFQGAVLGGNFFNAFYPRSGWRHAVRAAGLTAAAMTGLLRVLSGNHFPTDVFAGAFCGLLIGEWISRVHESEKPQSTPSASSPRIFRVQWRFVF
ncbi:MAG TPA: phosphatase PAP2 family protein [bacterium]|nr:phosphatase PAP2 family protein [bacterium]